MNENFIYKRESNPFTFWFENGKISLREYQKDLIFYWSGEEDKAKYALFDRTPSYSNLPTISSDGRFGAFSKVSSPLVFNGKNLESLGKTLSLSFWIAANSYNGKYSVKLTKKENFPSLEGDYSFGINPRGEIQKSIVLNFTNGTFTTLKNKIGFTLDPTYNVELSDSDENSFTLTSLNNSPFTLVPGSEGTDLLSLFDIQVVSYGTIPTHDIDLISLVGEHFSLTISHLVSGKLKFEISQGEAKKTTYIDWNNNGIDFDNIEVDLSQSVLYVFLNGKLLKTVLISPIERIAEDTVLTINGEENNVYSYEELILKSAVQNTEDFSPAISQLTKYDTTRPYIDFYYSGNSITKNSLTKLIAETSDNISLVLNYAGNFYYYSNGAWRSSDGSYNKSNDSYTFADYISEFNFDGNEDLFIRAYFESDGDTPAFIEKLYFTISDSAILGDGSETPAILVGKEFPDEEKEVIKEPENPDDEPTKEIVKIPQEIPLKDKELVITTDKGETKVTFEKDLTLDEVVELLNSLFPDGLAKIYRDAADRLVLISETKGDSALITVSGDAADTLFGDTKAAQGKDEEKNTLEKDYEEFIEKIKTYDSKDLIPVEINDDQIRLYLQEAINLYKKYRSDNINTYKVQLKGTPETGYEIPPVIENQHDITDILFRPLFPISFYNGFDNDLDDVISLSLVNALSGRGLATQSYYGQGLAQDYYISLMSIDTMEMSLGLKPSWKIYNNRLYIFPNNISKYMTVTILYKAPIDPIEALRDPYILSYCAGKLRQSQGEVRGQYGSTLSTGGLQIQFNADAMYERGKAMVEEAIKGMKDNQEPLGMIWG